MTIPTQSCYHIPSGQARAIARGVLRYAEANARREPGWEELLDLYPTENPDSFAAFLEAMGLGTSYYAALNYTIALVPELTGP